MRLPKINIELGIRIREKRTALGYTQAQLSQEMGRCRTAVTSWENGHKRVSAESLLQLAWLLRTDPYALYFGKPPADLVTPDNLYIIK